MDARLDELAPATAARVCGLLGRLHHRVVRKGDEVADAWKRIGAERVLARGDDADGERVTAFELWAELLAIPADARVAVLQRLGERVRTHNNTYGLTLYCPRCQSNGHTTSIGWTTRVDGGLHVEQIGSEAPPPAALRAKAVHNVRMPRFATLGYAGVVTEPTFTLACPTHGEVVFDSAVLAHKLHGIPGW